MPHIHWVARRTGIPKDRDEVNRREVCECDDKTRVRVYTFSWRRVFGSVVQTVMTDSRHASHAKAHSSLSRPEHTPKLLVS
jgi:hypothetical protein